MADITNPQVIKWSNERARTLSDSIARLYAQIVAYQSDYAAQGIVAAMTPFASGDILLDGSAQDGRAPVTKNQISVLNNALTQVKKALDQNTASIAGDYNAISGFSAMTWVNQIQVNGSPR